MKKIGITGARGFIGSHLVKKINDPIIFEFNLCCLPDVRNFVKECDRIYHIAGKNRDIGGEILRNNLISTSNIILAMHLEKKDPELIFISSTQVEWSPISEYSVSKFLEEHAVKEAKKWCIYRVPNVYGPGCRAYYNSVVATFCTQIAQDKELTVKDLSVSREFIYIDDLVRSLLNPEFNKYMRPKGQALTIGEIVAYLTDGFGKHKKLQKTLEYYMEKEGIKNGIISAAQK